MLFKRMLFVPSALAGFIVCALYAVSTQAQQPGAATGAPAGAHVHETDRHFHQSDHLRFNHSRHFAKATAGPAPWGGACRWRLT